MAPLRVISVLRKKQFPSVSLVKANKRDQQPRLPAGAGRQAFPTSC